ncbi:MAG TPA: 50S ribosomal protein L34, partial [Candidatus Mediterraneibacter stercoravium]|nr:50S ribosomal protein L34 [Candidatus Mediterraneibacter stercoravium]
KVLAARRAKGRKQLSA